jgi:hypothetical protein
MLVGYVKSMVGINTNKNISIKYQTNLIWPKFGTNLILILVDKDFK